MGSRADAANPMTKIDAIIAERDAEIAALKAELTECQVKRDMWEHYYEEEAKGASYMEADIKKLREQVAELENALSKQAEQQARMWEVFRGMASAYHEIRSNTDLRFNYYMTQLDKLRD